MPDSNNNRNNGVQSNQSQANEGSSTSTTSTLPILFANGYPTSLDKMTEEQLSLFIPFLIKCSLKLKMDEEPKVLPAWWPSNLSYSHPFVKPKDFRKVKFNTSNNFIVN
jgi:hypothetical protein